MKSKIKYLILTSLMAVLLFGTAINVNADKSGKCGDNLTYTLDDSGTLTISGTGDMYNWTSSSKAPWYSSSYSIKSVTIPNGVTSIGDYAFYNCCDFEDLIIPDSVVSIGDYAFYYCDFLKRITIGKGVESIGERAFEGYNIMRINVSEGNNYYSSVDGNLYNKDKTELILYALGKQDKSFTTPEGLKKIGDYAFSVSTLSLRNITISEGVTSIGVGAFYDCRNLKNVTIPKSVYTIGENAFYKCSLENLTLLSFVSIENQGFSNIGQITCYPNSPAVVYAESRGYTCILIMSESINIGNDTYYYSVNDEDNAEIVGCKTTSTAITIPLTLDGHSVTKVGYGGFVGCKTLTSVTLHSQIESIGDSAFEDCTGLVSITIPPTVTEVGNRAFGGCTALENVTISEGVQSIGTHAFYGCTSLKEAVIPDSVENLGEYAYYNCATLEKVTTGTNLQSIEQYTFYGCGKLATIVVGTSVDSIGAYAFYGTALERINLPAAVKSIGNRAFESCTALTRVQIRNGLEGIGEYAFASDALLAQITLPSSLTSIGKYAFYNCSALEKVSIPSEITAINDSVFEGSGLKTVTLNKKLQTIGNKSFYNCDIGEISFPSSLTSIGNAAFSNNASVSEIVLPDGMVSLGEQAFLNCTALSNISVADKLSTIGENAFDSTNNLNVNIRFVDGTVSENLFKGQAVAAVTMEDGIISIGNYAFSDCTGLKTIKLSTAITGIGNYAFSGNPNFTELTLPDYVESIGAYAFYNCSNLRTLSVSDKLKNIGESAFDNCSGLKINIRTLNKEIAEKLFSGQNICFVNIYDGCSKIGESAFNKCSALKEISIPDTVVTVGNNAFSNGNSIKLTIRNINGSLADKLFATESEINRSGSISTVIIENGISHIGASAFENSSISSLTVNGNLKTIAENTFKNTSMSNVLFKGNVDKIDTAAFGNSSIGTAEFCGNVGIVGVSAFENGSIHSLTFDKGTGNICENAFKNNLLESILVKGNVGDIEKSAFEGCLNLNSAEFKGDITSIADRAFYNCKLLTSLVLPDTVSSIGEYAFYNCNSLADINLPTEIDKINDYTFYGCVSLKKVSVPKNVLSIGDYSYYGCTELNEVNLNNSLKTIGKYAFYNCNKLNSIIYPTGITSVGEYSFRGCSSLKSIVLPNSLTALGANAYYGCTSLETVSIGNGISELEDGIFYGCMSLEAVMLPDDISYIDDYTFYGCDNCVLYCADNGYVEAYAEMNFLGYVNTAGNFELTLTPPSKTEYFVGDELDLTGMVLTATYGSNEVEILQGYEISGFDKSIPGKQTVSITYKGQTVTFDVLVVIKGCESITVTPPTKRTYYTGQELDLTGMTVIANFEDGTTSLIENGYTVTGYDSVTSGVQTITVSYGSFTAEFKITLIERTIESISVAEASKKKYYVGDEFDYSNTIIIISYNDGETISLTADNDKVAVSGFDSSSVAESQTVTVSYTEKFTTEFTIAILEPEKPLTTTTYRKISDNYRFYVNFTECINDAEIIISLTDKNHKLLGTTKAMCDGDDTYILNIPTVDGAAFANIFTWNSLDSMRPLGIKETVSLE